MASFVLYRSKRQCHRDTGSILRPSYDRARIPRHERGVGIWPTVSTKHLDECCRVSLELVDAHTGRIVGVVPSPRKTLRPKRFSVGGPRTSAFSCGLSESSETTHSSWSSFFCYHASRIISTENPRLHRTTVEIVRLTFKVL